MKVSASLVKATTQQQLFEHGVASLTDAELLATLLGGRGDSKRARELAYQLQKTFGSLAKITKVPASELLRHPGVDQLQAARLLVGIEIARRVSRQPLSYLGHLSSLSVVKSWLLRSLSHLKQECVVVFYLTTNADIITYEELYQEGIDPSEIPLRKLLERVFYHNAKSVLLAHNHPSGRAYPSRQDSVMTSYLLKVLKPLEIELVDHLVVGHGQVFSILNDRII